MGTGGEFAGIRVFIPILCFVSSPLFSFLVSTLDAYLGMLWRYCRPRAGGRDVMLGHYKTALTLPQAAGMLWTRRTYVVVIFPPSRSSSASVWGSFPERQRHMLDFDDWVSICISSLKRRFSAESLAPVSNEQQIHAQYCGEGKPIDAAASRSLMEASRQPPEERSSARTGPTTGRDMTRLSQRKGRYPHRFDV